MGQSSCLDVNGHRYTQGRDDRRRLSINRYVLQETYLNENCSITLNHVVMIDPVSGAVVLNQSPLMNDNSPITREIKEHRTGQFQLSGLTFNFDRGSFPYDVKLKMRLICPNEKTEHEFSKKIRFRMVQPVMWEQ